MGHRSRWIQREARTRRMGHRVWRRNRSHAAGRHMEGEQACGDHSQDRRNYHDRVQTKWKQHHRFQSNSSVCGRIRVWWRKRIVYSKWSRLLDRWRNSDCYSRSGMERWSGSEWKRSVWSMDGTLAFSLFLPSFSILMVESHYISYCFVNHIKTKLFICRIHRFHLAQNSIHR